MTDTVRIREAATNAPVSAMSQAGRTMSGAMPPALRSELHWGRMMTCYADRPHDVNDMLARSFALSPDSIAVVDGERRVTYRELDAAAATIATNLAARGVRQGDRVALMLPNRFDTVLSVIAIARLGAIVVPIGTRLRQPEIGFIFDDAQPTAIVFSPEFAAELPDNGPAAAMRFECGSADWKSLTDATNAQPAPTTYSASSTHPAPPDARKARC